MSKTDALKTILKQFLQTKDTEQAIEDINNLSKASNNYLCPECGNWLEEEADVINNYYTCPECKSQWIITHIGTMIKGTKKVK